MNKPREDLANKVFDEKEVIENMIEWLKQTEEHIRKYVLKTIEDCIKWYQERLQNIFENLNEKEKEK